MKRAATIVLTFAELKRLLDLPQTVEIEHVESPRLDAVTHTGQVHVYVSGEAKGLPLVVDGWIRPQVLIEMEQDDQRPGWRFKQFA